MGIVPYEMFYGGACALRRGEGTPLCGWREDRDKLTVGHIRKEIFA